MILDIFVTYEVRQNIDGMHHADGNHPPVVA